MTVEINQKKLYYNHYTSGKFLILKFKFKVKSSDTPLPQLKMLSYVPDSKCTWELNKKFLGCALATLCSLDGPGTFHDLGNR
jgi:hypothetical protein